MIMYGIQNFNGGAFEVIEVEVSAPNEMYFSIREEAQEECDYWNKELQLNKD